MAGKKRSVKLKTVSDVNRFMAQIINQLNRDEIEANKASKLGYLSNLLIQGIRTQDLEDRVEQLEKGMMNLEKTGTAN